MKKNHWSLVINHWAVFTFAFCLPARLLLILLFAGGLPFALFSQFTITPTIINATCPDTSNGSASVSVSGGNPPYTYQWQPDGQTSPTITGLTPGTYTITISDNSSNDTTVTYIVGPLPFSPNEVINNPVCTNNGYINLSLSGGTAGYQYLWSTGSANSIITQIGEGVFSVVVTDANSCTASFSYQLTLAECDVEPAQFFTPNGDGYNDTWSITNAQYFDNARVIVFDRWGTRVHEQKGIYESWDGKSYLGIPVPDAVYYFFFFEDRDNEDEGVQKGSVTILR